MTPNIIETLFNRTAALNAEHEAKIEDVKDSITNKDWVLQGWFQKTIFVVGVVYLVCLVIKGVTLLW